MRPVSIFLLLAALLASVGGAQEGTESPVDGIDRLELEARLQSARDREAVEGDSRRGELILAYTGALAGLENAEQWIARRAALLEAAEAATARRTELELELAGDKPPLPDLAGRSLEQLETDAVAARAERDRAKSELEKIEAEQAGATERRRAIAQQLADLLEQIDAYDETLRIGALPEEDAELAAARLTVARVKRFTAIAHADSLRAEEQTFDDRADLRAIEVRVARRRATRTEAELQALDAALLAERLAQAERDQRQAKQKAREALMQGSPFSDAAERTLVLRESSVAVAERLEEIVEDLGKSRAELADLEKRFNETERRVDIMGLTNAISLHLRQERLRLADLRAAQGPTRDLQTELTDTQVLALERSIEQDGLRDEESWLDDFVAKAVEKGMAEGDARDFASQFLQERFDALRADRDILKTKIDRLFELDVERREYREKLDEYDDYVAERVLWIRSALPVWRVPAEEYANEIRGFLDPDSWHAFFLAIRRDAALRPAGASFLVVGLAALFGTRRRTRHALEAEGEVALQRQQVKIRPTLRALLYSTTLAFTYIAPFLALSYLAGSIVADDRFAAALGNSCGRAAAAALILGSLRVLTIKGGLAECHFEWPERAVRLLRRQSTLVLPITPTAALVGDFLLNVDVGLGESILATFAFAVEAGSVLFFAWRVLHPTHGILALGVSSSGSIDWMYRLRRVWFMVAVGISTSLVVLVLLGYGYSARNLLGRLEISVGFLLALIVVRALALRWITLVRRNEAFERRRRKRVEEREKRLAEIARRRDAGEDVEELESEGLEVEEQAPDFAALSSDVRDLVRLATGIAAIVGVVAIWSTVLPALGFFNRVRLWQREVSVVDYAVGAKGVEQPVLTTVTEWVTLVNFGVAVLILLLTWVVVRNLSAVLELVLFRRLGLGSGERYAIATLISYLFTLIGVGLAFQEIGLAWSKLQWLVAGVSVGLGFGLQEIFANFISGLMLLFERPVRVGDWVTLGEVEGVVSKIRIRATTIRDRDLKELIVPNREFITGRFINWTLSDPVSRVTIPVGIAYGSDTESAIRHLLEAGKLSSYTVSEPAPNVVFTGFGDSSLEFELRVFVSGRESIPRVVHDLHMRVDVAFRAAGIEIAFPQRDLHVRSAPGLDRFGPTAREGS